MAGLVMQRFGVKMTASFTGHDVSTWVSELLVQKELGEWVYQKIKNFFDSFLELLMQKP